LADLGAARVADDDVNRTPAPWRPNGRQIFGIIVLVLLLVFAFVNLEKAKIDFVFTQVTIPIFFVIAVPALLGFALGMFFQRHQDRRRG
jgi:uncharacterized integral membrane protein